MRVINVDKNHIKQFVDFPQKLYADDDKYVPYMLADLTKTLKRLILKDKTYRALLVTEKDEVLARVLFTVDKNKQLNTEKCGFFCMFECIDSQKACNLMLDEMVRQMRDMGGRLRFRHLFSLRSGQPPRHTVPRLRPRAAYFHLLQPRLLQRPACQLRHGKADGRIGI